MAGQVKSPLAKPDNLGSTPAAHAVRGENQLPKSTVQMYSDLRPLEAKITSYCLAPVWT